MAETTESKPNKIALDIPMPEQPTHAGKATIEPGDLIEWSAGGTTMRDVAMSVTPEYVYVASRVALRFCRITRNYGPAEIEHDDGTLTRPTMVPLRGHRPDLDRVVSIRVWGGADQTSGAATVRLTPDTPAEDPNAVKLAEAVAAGECILPLGYEWLLTDCDPGSVLVYHDKPKQTEGGAYITLPDPECVYWNHYLLGKLPEFDRVSAVNLADVRRLVAERTTPAEGEGGA